VEERERDLALPLPRDAASASIFFSVVVQQTIAQTNTTHIIHAYTHQHTAYGQLRETHSDFGLRDRLKFRQIQIHRLFGNNKFTIKTIIYIYIYMISVISVGRPSCACLLVG